jgi:general secretion pathway protein G
MARFHSELGSGVEYESNDLIGGFMCSLGYRGPRAVRRRKQLKTARRGFSIIELMIAMAIMAVLASLATLLFAGYQERAQITRAISEIHTIQDEIVSFQIAQDRLPVDLAEVNWDTHLDPWGNPYQYTNFTIVAKGKWRKDKFLVPINSSFDLWSMGPDGKTLAPLTAPVSEDDIIRANDGSYIGRASLY